MYVSGAMAFGKFTFDASAPVPTLVRDLNGLQLVMPSDPALIAPDIDRTVFEFDEVNAVITNAMERR